MFEEPPPSIPGDPPGASGNMRHPAAGPLLRSTAAWPSPSSPRLQPTPPSQFRSVRSSLRNHGKFAQSGTKTSLRPIPIEPELIRPNQTSIFFRLPSLAFFRRSHASLCLPAPAYARPATPKTAPFPVRPFNRPQCQSLHGLVSSPFKVIQAGSSRFKPVPPIEPASHSLPIPANPWIILDHRPTGNLPRLPHLQPNWT
jgi:hypothetical protein